MQKELPVRKKIRLEGYDYSSNGAYFITICTQRRLHLFGEVEDVVGQGLCSCRLTSIGEIIEREWYLLTERYPHIIFGNFVVMPNHVHAIISINRDSESRQDQSPCPTVGICVQLEERAGKKQASGSNNQNKLSEQKFKSNGQCT